MFQFTPHDWLMLALAISGPIVTGLFSLIVLFKVHETHVTFNSKMDKLLQLTDTAAFARGQKDQKDNPKQ